MNTPEQIEERKRLTVEIFELTGKKVEPEDPIVTAAFFYSAKLRQAAKEINASTERAHKALSAAVARSIAEASRHEATKIEVELSSFVDRLKKKLQASVTLGNEPEPSNWSVLTIACGLAIMGIAGVMVGAGAFGSPEQKITEAQLKQMRMGALFQEIIPTIDKPTQQKIITAMKKRAKQSHSK
jgi:hypothetical protein